MVVPYQNGLTARMRSAFATADVTDELLLVPLVHHGNQPLTIFAGTFSANAAVAGTIAIVTASAALARIRILRIRSRVTRATPDPLHHGLTPISHHWFVQFRVAQPRYLITSLAVVALMFTAASSSVAAPTNVDEERIATMIERRLHNPRLGNDVAVLVEDVHSGHEVVANDANTPFLPASNMKIITAVNALTVLGPDHRFSTRVALSADGTTLRLIGGGDPLLGDTQLASLADATLDALAGAKPTQLAFDDSLFTGRDRGPGWTGGYVPYVVAPVRALAKVYDYSSQPEVNATKSFASALAKRGVKTKFAGRSISVSTDRELATNTAHTVRGAVRLMLQVSENNVAEILYRHVAVNSGQPGNWSGARAAAKANLEKLGIDTHGAFLADGSGVSRDDRVTATQLVDTLELTADKSNEDLRMVYYGKALPTAGESGTLDARYGRYTSGPSACARGAVFAKTGTLFDTIALSGFTTAKDGTLKAFSFLVNNRPQSVSQLTTRRAVDSLAATVNGCY